MQFAPPVPSRDLDMLTAAIAAAAGITVGDLRSRSRKPQAAGARRQLIRELFALGYQASAIARAVGIDHSTVVYLLGHTVGKPGHKWHEPAPKSLPAEHWIGRRLPVPATAARIADPDQVAATLPDLTDTQRRQVAAYFVGVLLADRPKHDAATLSGLRLLANNHDVARAAANYLVNIDRCQIGRQYWRDTAAGILGRMQLQARQVDIRWTTVPTRSYSFLSVPMSPPAPVPAAAIEAPKESPMPRIELIDPDLVPKAARNDKAVDDAAEWLTKALRANQAIVIHLLPDERESMVRKHFRQAALRAHVAIKVSLSPERRTWTNRKGKEEREAVVLYIKVSQPVAAKLERVV
jgi:hypothetical protein